MKFEHPERHDRFIDTIKFHLILWRRNSGKDFGEISKKLGISERTARRRFNIPGTLTLDELYAWCELYDKDPCEVLYNAFSEAKKPD
ncbi:MAG: hypothetical protein K2I93_00040 [Oscillospiraceae bacterium]|nr:hypothetical protein [Oscillospiraceae bacterium]